MGKHDFYGKDILKEAFKTFQSTGRQRTVKYGKGGGTANIDGTIEKKVAVEIESRGTPQVRGALLNLIFHKYEKKLLVILPVYQYRPRETIKQCQFILGKYIRKKNFRVVKLNGSGKKPRKYKKKDILILRKAVKSWRLTSGSS